MDKQQLESVMLFQLQNFNNEAVTLTNDTVHNTVLSETDGFKPSVSSKKLYHGAIMWTVWANKGKNSRWPATWMNMAVSDLADFIISNQSA